MNNKKANSNLDALFIGWQEKITGEFFPIYMVTAAGHPLCGSSVSEKYLGEQNLRFSKQHHPKKKENISDMPRKKPGK